MNVITQAATVIRHPSLLRNYQPILLLSHMRANTSLLGHILGENPEIEGYYELHIGYYSWRSLINQKLVYFRHHKPKRSAHFMFDKVLHNQHGVNIDVFRNGKVIFALRPPERTIRSIVNLYQREHPDDSCATTEGAVEYYVQRLHLLERLAQRSTAPYFYMDSDVLRDNTKAALSGLSLYLGLREPLSGEYSKKPLTGQRRAGDSSSNIQLGHISRQQDDYSSIPVDEKCMARAQNVYQAVRESIMNSPMVGGTALR